MWLIFDYYLMGTARGSYWFIMVRIHTVQYYKIPYIYPNLLHMTYRTISGHRHQKSDSKNPPPCPTILNLTPPPPRLFPFLGGVERTKNRSEPPRAQWNFTWRAIISTWKYRRNPFSQTKHASNKQQEVLVVLMYCTTCMYCCTHPEPLARSERR